MRAQSGHEVDEQSVAGQAVYRKSSFREVVGYCVPKECQVVKGMPNSQESFEWSGGRQTGIKAPNNQDGKECSKESDMRAPSDQQDIEPPVVSRGRLAVRRAS